MSDNTEHLANKSENSQTENDQKQQVQELFVDDSKHVKITAHRIGSVKQTVDCHGGSVHSTIRHCKIETLTVINNCAAPGASSSKTAINNCLPPLPSFVGRDDDLQQLSQLLEEHHVVVLAGMGGVGKTQVARKFATDNTDKYRNCIYWLEAETAEDLKKSVEQLAQELGVSVNRSSTSRDAVLVLKEIYGSFAQDMSLLIFDNVEKREDMYPYLPRTLGFEGNLQLHIVVTSRRTNWTRDKISTLLLEPLPWPVALELFKKIFVEKFEESSEAKWKTLAELLGFLPLALQVAASYIQYFGCTVTEYIAELAQGANELIEDPLAEYNNRSIYSSMKLTVEQLKRKTDRASTLAVRLLNVGAYLNPDVIPRSYLLQLVGPDEEATLSKALVIITDFSFMNRIEDEIEGHCYTMHRIIQKSVRYNQTINESTDEYYKLALHIAVTIQYLQSCVFQYADAQAATINNYYSENPAHSVLLRLLIKHGQCRALKAIFDTKAADEVKSLIANHTLLHLATECEVIDICQLLYDSGADINQRTSDDVTPLHVTCLRGFAAVVHWLLQNGASPRAIDTGGDTPFHYATRHGDKILSLLIAKDTSAVQLTNGRGETALFYIPYYDTNLDEACMISAIRVLIANGASITKPNNQGRTPLHCAAEYARAQVVSFILQSDSQVGDVADNDGLTALHIVGGDLDISLDTVESTVRILCDNGLSLDREDKQGRTPLDTVLPKYRHILHKVAEEYGNRALGQPTKRQRTQ